MKLPRHHLLTPRRQLRLLAILALSICTCLRHASAGEDASSRLRSVEELPVDRFDDYEAGSFPPFPWVRLGEPATGLSLTLETAAESPFVGNKATGKGLVLRDESVESGAGAGITCSFVPPPQGDLYLGFDLQIGDTQGLALNVELGGEAGPGLVLDIGDNHELAIIAAGDARTVLATLESDTWYHLALVVSPAGEVTAWLNDARAPKTAVSLPASTIAPPMLYTHLSFTSSGPAEATGSWSLDNICMGGRVEAERQPWWPFDQLPIKTLRKSPHKVFAYYFIYSSGYSEKDPGLSWYTRTVLNPTANNKADRKSAGTELLLRPFPRPPLSAALSQEEILLQAREEEIRMARMIGLDGFLVDFWAYPHPTNGQAYFSKNSFALLDAAQQIDPSFKILPALYGDASQSGINGEADAGCTPLHYADSPILARILAHPATLRMPDGRIALSMWLTERHSVDWWKEVMAILESRGTPIALISHFNSTGRLQEFSPISAAMAHWGPREPRQFDWVDLTRKLTPTVIFPICQQDVRTRGCTLWECGGSETLTGLWQQAINDGADWAFVNTWSDYSEQAMQPSTFIGYAPHDLNAYYIQWFKTGEQPKIVRDTLYYFYRRNHTEVDPGRGVPWKFRGVTPAANEIELLAFLQAPGTLRIQVGDKLYQQDAPAGITRFTAPLPPGESFVPEFSLVRNEETVIRRQGHFAVLDKVEYPHMIYSSGVIAPDRPEKRPWYRRLFW